MSLLCHDMNCTSAMSLRLVGKQWRFCIAHPGRPRPGAHMRIPGTKCKLFPTELNGHIPAERRIAFPISLALRQGASVTHRQSKGWDDLELLLEDFRVFHDGAEVYSAYDINPVAEYTVEQKPAKLITLVRPEEDDDVKEIQVEFRGPKNLLHYCLDVENSAIVPWPMPRSMQFLKYEDLQPGHKYTMMKWWMW